MIMEEAFLKDFHAGSNADEAKELKWWILDFVNKRLLVTADEIYKESECGDIAMYLALHELVTNGLIEGTSPYDESMRGTKHTEWEYSRSRAGAASFFSGVAVGMSKAWDPDKWSVNTVLPGGE